MCPSELLSDLGLILVPTTGQVLTFLLACPCPSHRQLKRRASCRKIYLEHEATLAETKLVGRDPQKLERGTVHPSLIFPARKVKLDWQNPKLPIFLPIYNCSGISQS